MEPCTTDRPKEYLQIDFEHIDLLDKDPKAIWEAWFKEAQTLTENKIFNLMGMATVRSDGRPALRNVLMHGYDEKGFHIYTDYASPKGEDLVYQNSVALAFFWSFESPNHPGTRGFGIRQVRIEGVTEKLTQAENEAYFEQGSNYSKIRNCVVEKQSQRLTSQRKDQMLREAQEMLRNCQDNPSFKMNRPENVGGYVVLPRRFEFYQATPPHTFATRVTFRPRTDFGAELPEGVENGKGDWVFEYTEC